MQKEELELWLRETSSRKLANLWKLADKTRQKELGKEILLRAIIEISNYCDKFCLYCGLRVPRTNLKRYYMTEKEIISTVAEIKKNNNIDTVIIQSGENAQLSAKYIAKIVQQIKSNTNLAVTLSLGQHNRQKFAIWKRAGADRYLLKIETTHKNLLKYIQPGNSYKKRLASINNLKELGYEVGSGIMVGIPGQTYTDLVKDLVWFEKMSLDMIAIGPYIPHPDTPLYKINGEYDQVVNNTIMTYKVIALARLQCNKANIPATTALSTLDLKRGRARAYKLGANVCMLNFTPDKYKQSYDIYPRITTYK